MVNRAVGMARPKGRRYFSDEQLQVQDNTEAQHLVKAPHTFVITQGKTDRVERELCADIRKVMEPFTATKLRPKRKNSVRDFVAMAGFFHVTHMLVLNKTAGGKLFLRVGHLPRGPTLVFEIQSFSSAAMVRKTLKKVVQMANQQMSSPLLIQNNFSGDGMHFKLMSTMFQNMLPSININRLNLNNLKRCLLLNYNSERDVVEWRHYSIRVVPVGIAKATKKLVERKIPNLGEFKDISDFVDNADMSESDGEELQAATNRIVCPDEVRSKGNVPGEQSALKLYELGPRLTLKLVKIEDGLCAGKVLYSTACDVPNLPQYVTKPEDIAPPPKKRKRPEKKKRTHEEKRAAKLQRRRERLAIEMKQKSNSNQEQDDTATTSKRRPVNQRGGTGGKSHAPPPPKNFVKFKASPANKRPVGIVRGFAAKKAR